MITSTILSLIFGIVWLITLPLRALSDVVLPANIANSLSTAGAYIQAVDIILPINTLSTILLLFISIEATIFSYKVIMWIIRRIPTQS